METKGYIPEGGVWTATERAAAAEEICPYGDGYSTCDRTIMLAHDTVDALLVALLDAVLRMNKIAVTGELTAADRQALSLLVDDAKVLIAEIEK